MDGPALPEAMIRRGKASVGLGKATFGAGTWVVVSGTATIGVGKAGVDLGKAMIALGKATVVLGKATIVWAQFVPWGGVSGVETRGTFFGRGGCGAVGREGDWALVRIMGGG